METNDGTFTYDPEIIHSIIHNFFKNSYTSNHIHPTPNDFPTSIPFHSLPKLSISDQDSLLFNPTENEIKNIVFSLHPFKAPGIDGLNAFFYQKSWPLIKNTITSSIQEIFQNESIPPSWGDTLLCLIPKSNYVTKPNHLRPIGLCTLHYKILSKLITNRIKPLIGNLISPYQGAFQKGKQASLLWHMNSNIQCTFLNQSLVG